MVQGRIVWAAGDLFKGQVKKDQKTRQPLIGKDGQPIIEYGFGLAVPKSSFATPEQMAQGQPGEFWRFMWEEAFTLYPSRQLPPAFAMKFKDGDTSVDDRGVSYSQREGYPGHLVLSCMTRIPIKFFRWDAQLNSNVMINEGIKVGDYVNVQLQIKAHGAVGQAKPGLYVNPMAVQFLGYGKEIINAPSGDQMFGIGAPTLPPGASATPVAQPGYLTPSQAPAAAPMPGFAPMPGQSPTYGAPPVQPQQPAPHYGVVPQQFQPQAPVAQVPPQYGTPPAMPVPAGNAPNAAFAAPGANGYPTAPGYPQTPAAPMNPGVSPGNIPIPF